MAMGIIAFLLMALVGLFMVLGWIVPLVMGSVWRSNNRPGANAWTILAAVWGSIALLLVVGLGVVTYLGIRESQSGYENFADADEFKTSSYTGEMGTARVSFNGEGFLMATCGSESIAKYTTSNGVFSLPVGPLQVHSYGATAVDGTGDKWTVSVTCDATTNFSSVEAGAEQNLKLGPPFKASMEITYSPVSETISMEPIYVDSGNNTTTISSQKRTAPKFEVLDNSGKVVWSGDFEYG